MPVLTDAPETVKNYTAGPDGNWRIAFRSLHLGEWSDVMSAIFAPHQLVQVWDDFNDGAALEDFGVPRDQQEIYFNAKVNHWGLEGVVPHLVDDQLTSDVWMIYWHIDDPAGLKLAMSKFIDQLHDLTSDIRDGGDDYFDYYPDLWDVADQIIPAASAILGTTELMEHLSVVRQDVINTTYLNGDEDYLNGELDNKTMRAKMIYRKYLTVDGHYTVKGLEWMKTHQFIDLL